MCTNALDYICAFEIEKYENKRYSPLWHDLEPKKNQDIYLLSFYRDMDKFILHERGNWAWIYKFSPF